MATVFAEEPEGAQEPLVAEAAESELNSVFDDPRINKLFEEWEQNPEDQEKIFAEIMQLLNSAAASKEKPKEEATEEGNAEGVVQNEL